MSSPASGEQILAERACSRALDRCIIFSCRASTAGEPLNSLPKSMAVVPNRVGSCVTDSRFVSRPRRRDQRRTRRPVFRPTGARVGSVGYVRKRYKTSGGPCARLRSRTDPRSRMLIRLRSCLRERVSRRHSSAAQDPSGGGCLVTTPGHSGRAFSGCRRAMQINYTPIERS